MAKSKKKNVLGDDAVLAWHFLPSDKRLKYGDGRLAKVGETLSIDDDEETDLCSSGMHASEDVGDAAKHEAGPVLSRVIVRGDIQDSGDKLCGRHRTVLWMKELTLADMHEIGKKVGDSQLSSASNVGYALSYLGSSYFRDAKGRALVEWAKKNGLPDDDKLLAALPALPPVAPSKPKLTEKVLLDLLHPRVVRTKHEIMKEISGFYNTKASDGWCDDMFDQIMDNTTKVHIVENFTKSGANGYLRVSRK